MKRYAILLLTLVATPTLATTPQQVLSEFDKSDPLYNSQACLEARNIAMQYNNKGFLRGTADVATLLGGPLSTGIYAVIDNGHVKNRQAVIDEMRRRCISNYGTAEYSSSVDLKECSEKDGKIQCEPSS